MSKGKGTIMSESNLFVSVIIPVYNDSQRLEKCLRALESQTYPQNLYEVIVVDNNSDEDIKALVSQFGQASATYESRPGSYVARNKGISLAKGTILAFTDSDCIPAPDWLEKGIVNLLRVPECGLVAGKIELFFKNPDQPTAVELHQSIEAFNQKRYVEELRFGATANMFTFRSVIDKVGPFNEILKSSGDCEWGQRVHLAGYKQIYSGETCVAHPARHSLVQLYKKIVRLSGGFYDLNKKKGYPLKKLIVDIARELLPSPKTYSPIWSSKKLNGTKQRIQVSLITLLINYISAWEKIRLQLGGSSTRI